MDARAAQDYARARVEFEEDRSDPRALYELGRLAQQGLGEPVNETRAASLFRAASEAGHEAARIEYAFALGSGRGVEKDAAQAQQLLEAMSAEGKMVAQVYLGRALRNGWWGLPKDEARAAALFQKAMEAGDDNGRYQYATALMFGVGLAKDEARAVEVIKVASDRGHVDSQLEYARWLTYGIGLPKDEAAGTMLYRKAAELNNRIAQYGLGLAYLQGRGMPRDEKMAVRWIDASARQGWDGSALKLGDMFRDGVGVPKSRSDAYYWYSVAARGENSAVTSMANASRSALAKDMEPKELNRLVSIVEQFKPQPGFKPRLDAFPQLARGERIDLGAISVRVPLPTGYVNGWQAAESLQQMYPNDPNNLPWLMVLRNQEDIDRVKMGLSRRVRHVEFTNQYSDESLSVTPKLFEELKGQLKSKVHAAVETGRYRVEEEVLDEEGAYGIIRTSVMEPGSMDALAFVLLKEKVLMVAFKGFSREQQADLAQLVRGIVNDMKSANGSGFSFFSRHQRRASAYGEEQR